MFQLLPYDRDAAVRYAMQWAYRRNPAYYDFSSLGGDCTNFASQCIYAGAGVMNDTPVYGWYYRSANDRTASWTGVAYLYNFLVGNKGVGPFAREIPLREAQPGDIVQIAIGQTSFVHSPVIVRTDGIPTLESTLIAAHSNDCSCRPLATYDIWRLRCLHIEGVRQWM